MRKCYILIIVNLFLFLSCSTVTELPKGEGHFSETISLTEPGRDEFVKFPGTEVEVKFVYSSDSMRVFLRVVESRTTGVLLVNGLSVWIDPGGGKEKEYGVTYPGVSLAILERYLGISPGRREENDSAIGKRFEPSSLVKNVEERGIVLQSVNRSQFAASEQASIFIDEYSLLNYQITLPFSFIGLEDVDGEEISVGIVSEGFQVQSQQSRQPSGAARPGGRSPYPQQRAQQSREDRSQQARDRIGPINSWLVFQLLFENDQED